MRGDVAAAHSPFMTARPIKKVLIANRGEIACRIAATCRRLGIATVAVYSEADADALHVRSCDEAIAIGPSEAAKSYLVPEKLIQAAVECGADALHPGYGFLSENAALAQACADAGVIFIGPGPDAIRSMGSKIEARRLAARFGIPCVPGYDADSQDDAVLAAAAAKIGFPLVIKASAGGGGKGIRIVNAQQDFAESLELVRREAQAAFGDASVLLEKFVRAGRHIEVQVLGDTHGNVVHLFDRECSMQRRHQKIIEEAPAPLVADAARHSMQDMAVRLARGIGYASLGTVEFLYDAASRDFFFLEMNTRIQVEHPVTEMVTGLDLVELQIGVAEGRPLPFAQADLRASGHAIEARLNAERPERDFSPVIGRIERMTTPHSTVPGAVVRFDTGIVAGSQITPYYDSMLAKVIVHAPDRERAREGLLDALASIAISVPTNAGYLQSVLESPGFVASSATTSFLDGFRPWAEPRPAGEAERMLLAAALHEALKREESRAARLGDDPWASLGAWRVLAPAGIAAGGVLHFEDDAGERFAVEVTGRKGAYRVRQGGDWFEARARRTEQGLFVRRAGRAFSARVTDGGDSLNIQIEGVRRTLRPFNPLETTAAARSGGGGGRDIVAHIPGLVVEVLVKAGDTVEAGQRVLVLEAMKMMHNLAATEAATVAEVLCRSGEAVEMGRTLIRFAGAEKSAREPKETAS